MTIWQRIEQHLVDDWRQAHKFLSVQLSAINVALLGVWIELPADIKSAIPSNLMACVAIGIAILSVIGRLANQPNVGPKT